MAPSPPAPRRRGCRLPAPLTLALCLLAATRLAALSPDKQISQLVHTAWRDELPQNTVHGILQTRDGYLWIGTYEGLARFDGVRFAVYDRHLSGDLEGTAALHLAEDADGRLWVATNGGLTVRQEGRFRTYGLEDGLPSLLVTTTLPASDGVLWIGTGEGLAERRDGRIVPRRDLVAGHVAALAAAPDGTVWAATLAGLVGIRDGEAERLDERDGLPSAACRAVLVDRGGTLWVGTDGGLARRRHDGGFDVLGAADGLGDDYVRALAEDRAGSLWVGTESAGLVRLREGRVERFTSAEGLSHDYVRSIHEDREGSLWVGTNGGLNRFREGKFALHGTTEGLSHDFVRSVFQDRDGTIWAGTDGGGINRRTAAGWQALTTAEGLSHDSIRAIWQDRSGALWIGTRNGLDRLRDGELRHWGTADGLPSPLIRAVFADTGGSLWVGTEGGGLVRLDGDDSLTVFTTADGLAGDDVRAIFEDRAGTLWIGTFSGASRFEAGRFTSYRVADGLSNDIVFAFHEDADGNLWIGTDSGLNLLRDGRFTSFGVAEGLPDSKVFRILEDDRGNLWTSSNRGLARISREELLAVADGRRDQVVATAYDKADGMRANQVNGTSQPAGWRATDGHLWFPTVAGLVEVDPGDLHLNELAPPVVVEEVRFQGRPVAADGAVEFPPDFENLEIQYTGLSLVAPERVTFRYRLVGADSGWVEAGARRVAYYTHLPPGSYRFEVEAANNDGVWSTAPAGFAFRVRTPATRTWWAYLLYLGAGVAAVSGLVAMRVRGMARANALLEERVAERTAALDEKVRELRASEERAHASELRAIEANQAKSTFLSNMSHELRTPLNSIIGFSQILQERAADRLEDKHRRFLGNIRRSGEHLLDLINDLLDLSKIEAGRLELRAETFHPQRVAEEVRELMRGISALRGIEIDLELPPGLPSLTADPARLRQVLLNLVSNAVKFSPQGARVTIRAAALAAWESPLREDSVRFEVVDRGPGIAPEHHELVFEEFRRVETALSRRTEGTGLGLALVKRLVEAQGGSVSVDSALGEGSTFTVVLPRVAHTPPAHEQPALLPPEPPAAPRRTVLVVEDDPASYHQLATALEADGYRVVNARDAEQALRVAELERPDLVTLDLLLVTGDGWEVLRRLKARPDLRDVPVIVVTRLENRELALTVGAADYFVKPVDGESFRRRVRELARPRGTAAEATVLLIEDDPAVHRLLGADLAPLGYRLVSTYDGVGGLEAARRERPSTIVLDLTLPEMSGFEVAAALRADPLTAGIPIVVLTGRELAEGDREALAGRIAALVPKGADARLRLRAAIAEQLR